MADLRLRALVFFYHSKGTKTAYIIRYIMQEEEAGRNLLLFLAVSCHLKKFESLVCRHRGRCLTAVMNNRLTEWGI
jgi:endonuclease/exonuclease/phosphatase (EEP) superfamily protein YafD